MTLADRSSTVYVFNYTHTPLKDNFTRVCAEKQIAPDQMVANLLDKLLRIRANVTRRNTPVVPFNPTTPTHNPSMLEKTINLRSSKMDELTPGSSWQTIKVAIIEALKVAQFSSRLGVSLRKTNPKKHWTFAQILLGSQRMPIMQGTRMF